jgi:predicted nucleic acid-binding protein
MKIYLDTCCYNRPLDDQSQLEIQLKTIAKMDIQEKIRDGTYKMVWSYMLNLENESNPNEEKRISIQLWENNAFSYCKSSQKVLNKGIELSKLGIKSKDALHIACTTLTNCDYFITCDKRLLNKSIEEIKIINPIDFVRCVNNNEN